MRIECPNCGTSYTMERLGWTLPEDPTKILNLTVVCMVCQKHFDATIETAIVGQQEQVRPKTWTQWLLLRPADVDVMDIVNWTTKTKMRDAK